MTHRSRFLVIASGITCLVFVLVFHFITTAGAVHPFSKGERLTIGALGPTEEIVVSTLFSHRRATGREYHIRSEGERRTVAVFDSTPAWSRPEGTPDSVLLVTRDLTETEISGLEATLEYYREVREEQSSATRHIHLRYFRGEMLIGEEFYIGFSLTSQLAHYESEGRFEDPDFSPTFAEFADEYGVSQARIREMMPFEMLENQETIQPMRAAGPRG